MEHANESFVNRLRNLIKHAAAKTNFVLYSPQHLAALKHRFEIRYWFCTVPSEAPCMGINKNIWDNRLILRRNNLKKTKWSRRVSVRVTSACFPVHHAFPELTRARICLTTYKTWIMGER